jgi:lysophospholipase L1-like esterase
VENSKPITPPEAGLTSFVIGSSTATSFIVDKNGNVGIGTTSPVSMLAVNGTITATSFTNGTNSAILGGNNLTTVGAIPYVSGSGILSQDDSLLWSTGRPNLHDWQAQISKIMAYQGSIANILWIGDSWASQGNITTPLTANLHNIFGNAGVGYIQFDSFVAPVANASITRLGTWTDSSSSATPGINGASTNSSDVATPASIAVSSFASTYILHYVSQPGGGTFQYKINSGGWTQVNTSAASTGFSSVTIGSLNSGQQQTLTIQLVTSGTAGVTLLGAYSKSNIGVIVNRIGQPGASTSYFSSLNSTFWQSEIASISPNVVMIMLGVNDMLANTAPSTVASNISNIISNVRAVMPNADIVLVPPSDIGQSGTTYTMRQYVDAQRILAQSLGVGFIDVYKNIGSYSTANTRGLYGNTTHVNVNGGMVISSLVESYLTNGVSSRISNSPTFGYSALRDSPSLSNSAFGNRALGVLTTGAYDSAFGNSALYSNQTGVYNSAFGSEALKLNVGASNLSAFGFQSLTAATGAGSTGVGSFSLSGVTSGTYNTGLGYNSGLKSTTGTYNTFLGANADLVNTTQHNYMTVIGAGAIGNQDNSIILGRSNDFIGIGTTTPWKALSVNGGVAVPGLSNGSTGYYACVNTTTGELSTSTTACGASSIKYKENVAPLTYGLQDVLNLNPVFFNYKSSYVSDQRRQVGFIAEEVASVTPEIVAYDSNGEIQGLDYPKFTAVLAKAIQELNAKLDLLATVVGQGTNALKNLVVDSLSSTVVYTRELNADKINAGDINIAGKVCVDDVCVTKDQFKELLLRSGVGATQIISGGSTGGSGGSTETGTSTSSTTDITNFSSDTGTSTAKTTVNPTNTSQTNTGSDTEKSNTASTTDSN